MKGSTFRPQKLLELLGELLDEGRLTPVDRERLNRWLREEPAARALYREHMELHARLHLDYRGGLAPEGMPGELNVHRPQRRKRWMALSSMAAALALVSLLGWWSSGVEDGEPELTDGVAVLSRSLGVVWEGQPHREGDSLAPGVLKLLEGVAQVEFLNGATVVLEGPAELEIVSADRAVFHRGRLRASVPEPAQGFVIEAPTFEAVDLGTEFAMTVGEDGSGEVHVVDGEVEIHASSGKDPSLLTGGKAARVSFGGEVEGIPEAGEGFVDRELVMRMSDDSWNSGLDAWRRGRHVYASDPATIVYFDFEDHAPWDRGLRSAVHEGPDGALVGAQWVSGRWPGKGAVDFKRVTDRIRLEWKGEMESLTLMTWLRIEGLSRRHNSVFLTDGWEKGEPHWHIGNGGRITFGIQGWATLHSEPVLSSAELGRWVHLAVTCDGGSGEIRLYLDGRLLDHQATSETVVPIRIGGAEIGNWQPRPGSQAAARGFNGRCDEFLLSDRVYSEQEVLEHYRLGNPYQ